MYGIQMIRSHEKRDNYECWYYSISLWGASHWTEITINIFWYTRLGLAFCIRDEYVTVLSDYQA